MKIGYARVSTDEQNLDLQIHALRKVGCNRIFTDYGLSGKGFDRPGLHEALSCVDRGITFIVWRLDRLGRSLPKLIQFVDELSHRGAHFQSLSENIDTTSSGGRLVFHIMGALAEFERALISERTRAGMEAARRRGRQMGRRPALTPVQAHRAAKDLAAGHDVTAIAEQHGITVRTLRRYVNALGD